jgi:hypothetical protein
LSYRLDQARRESYKKEFGGKENDIIIRSILVGLDGQIESKDSRLPVCLPYDCHFIDFKENDTLTVTICSDGLLSYNVDKIQVVKSLVAYKSLVGEFVQRRMLRIKRDNAKSNITHYDDIFCGTVNLGE